MYHHHLSVDESSIIWYSTEDMNRQFSLDQGHSLLTKLRLCTAIICHNDQIAMKLMNLLAASNYQFLMIYPLSASITQHFVNLEPSP